MKPFFLPDGLASPTPSNIQIMKEDTALGNKVRGFDSQESAFEDWAKDRLTQLAALDGETKPSQDDMLAEFVNDYLDGEKSILGMVWRRVGTDRGDSVLNAPVGKKYELYEE